MSHLHHINTFKLTLVEKGILVPETQIALTRTAYVCAFIRYFSLYQVPTEKHEQIMRYMLGYWNETFPVKGFQVIAEVNAFYLRLFRSLNSACDQIVLPIVKLETEVADYQHYSGYESLVLALMGEIEYKAPQFNEV